jgi:hypothetical protein
LSAHVRIWLTGLTLAAISGCATIPATDTRAVEPPAATAVALRTITLPSGWTAEIVRSAEQANAAPAFTSYAAPPYLPGTQVAGARTRDNLLTVRFSVPSEANPRGMGGWVAPFEPPLLALTPREAQILLQLPREPTHLSLVCLPPGTTADVGIVGPQPDMLPSSGTAIQINLMAMVPESAWGQPVPIEGDAIPESPPCGE